MRSLTLAFILTAQQVVAQPADAPVVTILPGDRYEFNKAAFDATDAEMKRLQGVERQHRSENWVPLFLIAVSLGVVTGVAVAVPLTWQAARLK